MGNVTDFHTHILPGIDDGSANIEESIALLKVEAEQGIKRIVATPHFYANHDRPKQFLERRKRAEEQLREELQRNSGLPQIYCGAEVYYFRGISEFDDLELLKIQGTSCIMIEMPMSAWSKRMYLELEEIYERYGLTPIIAHVDRYLGLFKNHEIVERLEALPVLVQANGNFVLNKLTSPLAIKYLRKNQIHLLGSDCHNLKNRPPNLESAIQKVEKRLGGCKIKQINQLEEKIFGT